MKVLDFAIEKGLYVFELESIQTGFHSHPAIEIIYASKGSFSCWTKDKAYTNLTFAIIDSNVTHRLSATDCKLEVVMIEGNMHLARAMIAGNNMKFTEGVYCQEYHQNQTQFINKLRDYISKQPCKSGYDPRVARMINFLDNHELDYKVMMKTLQELVFLSESRLSHLFKENVGISLKKYLLWSKLKKTIHQHLSENEDLFTSLIEAGFYDQPHFSKAFKTMLGVNPTKVYNSRTVQVLPELPS
jgi:AraC-like DNA-binding protein